MEEKEQIQQMRNERKREAWRLTLHSGGVVQYGCCLGFEELCISYQIIILPFPACLDSIRVASDFPVLVKELQWKKEQAETENQQGSCKQKAKINRVQTQRSRIQSRKRRSKHKGLGFKAAQSRKLAETCTPVRSRSNFPYLFLQLRRFFSKNRHKFYKT